MVKDSETPAKSGFISVALGLAIVAAIGFGSGVGSRVMFDEPISATAEPTKNRAQTEKKVDTSKSANAGAAVGEHNSDGVKHELETSDAFEPAEGVLSELTVTPIEPVLTNLSEPKNVWIRLEGSILSKKDSIVPSKVLAAQAGQQVMAYLRTIKLPQIEGSSGLQHINEDLNEVMRTFSKGEVRQFLISGFIVE